MSSLVIMFNAISPKSCGRAKATLLFATLSKTYRQPLSPPKFVPCNVNSFHTNEKETIFVDTTQSISMLLRKNGNFDSLTTSIGSVGLTPSLVKGVLLDLKDPVDAKKALTFFHWCSQVRHFRHEAQSYCVIIHILVRAGLLVDAEALLESAIRKSMEQVGFSDCGLVEMLLSTYELVLPGHRVFDLLVQTYSRMRMVELAFGACQCLGDHKMDLNLISYNNLLHVAQRSGQNDLAWKVLEYMLERRVYPNRATEEIMIEVMCKEGTLSKMLATLDKIHAKRCAAGITVSSTLVFRMIEEGRTEQAIMLLKRMLQKNMIFDSTFYSWVIVAHCKMGKLNLAYETHDEMVSRGCSPNSFVYTCLMGCHVMDGSIKKATRLMEEMVSLGLKPYDVTYNHLITGYSSIDKLEECLKYYEEMLKYKLLPNCSACNQILGKLCESGEVEKANMILTDLLSRGFTANTTSYSKLIDGYTRTNDAEKILQLYYEMQYKNINGDLTFYSSLVLNLCRCGKPHKAEKFLDVMRKKELIPTRCLYDALIRAYCQKGNSKSALWFYDEMRVNKFEPHAATFMILVKNILGCGHY